MSTGFKCILGSHMNFTNAGLIPETQFLQNLDILKQIKTETSRELALVVLCSSGNKIVRILECKVSTG